ncbi:sarcosine oxidase subunit delta [Mesorhizobium sp. WSM3860]|uniref:sarcosine oxidase subunit delta n=1 Tax=Mesorhizobium sp. WSM3860 TaxID=2029403 RepID=UPI000BB07870|nr:sarcosine oxidase subunit delta [Mesorhizobium sp. WSM3860]PBC03518.1 sarcosine oxidase subunit delta [Mesorhizobium sp. WSM3860]
MKLLDCPMNGPRNIDEFQSFGPLRQAPDADAAADAEWARHLFRADNRKGVVVEWWRHVPSNFFFLAQRDVVTNEIIRTYAPGSRP